MVFIEVQFVLFLVLSIIIHQFIPENRKWINLLISSLLVVGYISIDYLAYALLFAGMNYAFGLLQYNKPDLVKKRIQVAIVTLNVLLLVLFKYSNFILENTLGLASLLNIYSEEIPVLKILAPIGISFYTFQGIAYQLDIRRGHAEPERNLFKFMLFIIYFPKYMSGPVERTKSLLPQLNKGIKTTSDNLISGSKLFFWGLFKKLVIADHLILYINDAYQNTGDYHGLYLLFILVMQPIQIYTDFSGYTDIARGLSRMFGVELLKNFENPFTATNVTTFWRKWHMSLTRWCGDYIYNYIILKRRKWKKWGAVYAVFVTFFIIGIWHGPRWTYIILGLMQGLVMSYEFFTKRWRLQQATRVPRKLNNIVSRSLTYLFFGLSLVFFYAPSTEVSFEFVGNLFSRSAGSGIPSILVSNLEYFSVRAVLILGLLWFDYSQERNRSLNDWLLQKPLILRWVVYIVLLLILFSFGNFGKSDFIYAGF